MAWEAIPGLSQRQISTLEKGTAVKAKDRLSSAQDMFSGCKNLSVPGGENWSVGSVVIVEGMFYDTGYNLPGEERFLDLSNWMLRSLSNDFWTNFMDDGALINREPRKEYFA